MSHLKTVLSRPLYVELAIKIKNVFTCILFQWSFKRTQYLLTEHLSYINYILGNALDMEAAKKTKT